jgi:hypothetical protein
VVTVADPHPTATAAVAAPEGWEVLADPPEGVAWAAREPADPAAPDRFRANLVLTVVPAGGLGFRDWQTGTEELLPRVLDDYLVVDLERIEVQGSPGGRRLAHHAGPAGEALTMEQWFTLVDGVGHTLTATVETWRYDELADVCAGAARGWRPAPDSGEERHAD